MGTPLGARWEAPAAIKRRVELVPSSRRAMRPGGTLDATAIADLIDKVLLQTA